RGSGSAVRSMLPSRPGPGGSAVQSGPRALASFPSRRNLARHLPRRYNSVSGGVPVSILALLAPMGMLFMTTPVSPLTISKMAAAVQPSATHAAAAKARQLKAEGVRVFDFSLGEPDFPTPAHICQAAQKAMQEGHTHYTAANGTPELRAAVARWYQKTYG